MKRFQCLRLLRPAIRGTRNDSYFFLLLAGLCFFFCACQIKQNVLPPVEKIDHVKILQRVQQNHGKVTLVNVWATWCAPCKEEMPNLVKLRQKFVDKGFDLILVSIDDVEQADSIVAATLKQFNIDFQTYIKNDSTDEAFINGMNPNWSGALPTSFVYDKDGKLVETLVGERKYEQFEEAVKALMKN